MLDLKSKLLAAGLVTADQVKRVEEDQSASKRRADEARARREQAASQPRGRPERGNSHGNSHGNDGRDRGGRDDRGPRGPGRPSSSGGPRSDAPRSAPQRDPAAGRGPRSKEDEQIERMAKREREMDAAERWRKRVHELSAAGKSEQYEVIRGWVERNRLDEPKSISESAGRYHYAKQDGTIGHLTVEPAVKDRLAEGTAGIVMFMGFNGAEHAAVPDDLARDIHIVRPDWLRMLAGVTDVEPAATGETAPDAAAPDEASPQEAAPEDSAAEETNASNAVHAAIADPAAAEAEPAVNEPA